MVVCLTLYLIFLPLSANQIRTFIHNLIQHRIYNLGKDLCGLDVLVTHLFRDSVKVGLGFREQQDT